MNNVVTYTIKPGIRLHYIHTEQFKTLSVGVHFHRPLSEKEAEYSKKVAEKIAVTLQTL